MISTATKKTSSRRLCYALNAGKVKLHSQFLQISIGRNVSATCIWLPDYHNLNLDFNTGIGPELV